MAVGQIAAFPFDNSGVEAELALQNNVSSSSDLVRFKDTLYSPFNYSESTKLGEGFKIWRGLDDFSRLVWCKVFERQDLRGDKGHAEIVTYFAQQLALLAGLSESDTKVLSLAAILHDTGYSCIPGVQEQFDKVEREYLTSALKDNALMSQQELKLRILHQEHSVRIAAEVLEGYERKDEVLAIIADHDTRREVPSFLASLLWDADILWRVTLPALNAFQQKHALDRFQLIEHADAQLAVSHGKLQHHASLQIGRIEFARSLATLGRLQSNAIPRILNLA